MLNDDYRDILSAFLEEGVEFLIVGAYAVAAYGHPRSTGDIDLWVKCTEANADRILRALARFGAPMHEIDRQTFIEPGMVFQIGVVPRRIDVLTRIDGIPDFDEASSRRTDLVLDDIVVPVVSRDDLIVNKKATGRLQDLADVEWLESDE